MKHPIVTGLLSVMAGGIGVLGHGASNLSRGEANTSYTPSSANNFTGTVFSILFWGGILLIIHGLIIQFTSKD